MKRLLATTGLAALLTSPAYGQAMDEVLSEKTKKAICKGNAVDPAALLSRLANEYDINQLELKRLTSLDGQTLPDTQVASLAAFIIDGRDADIGTGEAAKAEAEKAASAGIALHSQVKRLDTSPQKSGFYLSKPLSAQDKNTVLKGVFAPILKLDGVSPVTIQCVTKASGEQAGSDTDESKQKIRFALRGEIDTLVIRNSEKAAFKSTKGASLSLTDNHEKGQSNLDLRATAGVQIPIAPRSAVIPFVEYRRVDAETDDPNDEDDMDDINVVSTGLAFRQTVGTEGSNSFSATLGGAAYHTWDLKDDAELFRARLFLSDFAFTFGKLELCDGTFPLKGTGLNFNCRLQVYAEFGDVLDPGRRQGLQNDEFIGIGFDVTSILSIAKEGPFTGWTLSSRYRRTEIVEGSISSPDLLTLSATYNVPNTGVSIGLTHEEGTDFESLKPVDLTKIELSVKF